jgi:hypothetical protein
LKSLCEWWTEGFTLTSCVQRKYYVDIPRQAGVAYYPQVS